LKLVLLPGLDGTGLLFRPLVEVLPPEIEPTVVRYPDDPTLGYRELMPMVLKSLPCDGAFAILGESFSGPMAIRAAAARPDGLVAVILAATFAQSPHPYIPPWAGSLVPSASLRLFPPFVKFKMLLAGYGTPELRKIMAEALSLVSARTLAHRLRGVIRVDVSSELRACQAPILYLCGDRDYVVPPRNGAAIERLQPSTRRVVFPAPHMVLQTQPVLAAQEISAFLAAAADKAATGGG
jgi:pimeloyl-[acyl-carrier protein] methyl ester esterase